MFACFHLIRSTVLGGEVVSEAGNTGDKVRSYVFAGGTKLAEMSYRYTFGPSQTHDTVNYFQQDAAGVQPNRGLAFDVTILNF